jgi:hypothetical protein
MSKVLSVLIIILLPTIAISQVKHSGKDTLKSWEIGLDLLWLIDKNQLPSTTLFARYNFSNGKEEKRAWRFRLGIDNSTYDSTQINDPRDNEIDIISPYVRVGYEWQKAISEKASYFYGVDVSTLYSQYKSKIVIYPGPNLLQVTDKTWEFGVIPFIGFKYLPIKWFAISAESSLNVAYRIRREKDKVTDIDFPNDPGFNGKIDINELKISLVPMSVINLSFYLTKK